MQFEIKDICNDDALAAFNAMREIYASTDMMCQPFSDKYPALASFQSEIQDFQAMRGAIFLIAKVSDSIVGYVTVKPQTAANLTHTAYLNMGVSESARGKSLGRQLVDAAIARLESEGLIEILYLNVRADNVAAVRLYESTKFDQIAVLTRDTKIGDKYYDGLLMRRFIASQQKASTRA